MIQKIQSGVLFNVHFRNVRSQRWDLTKTTRLTITIFLN